MSQIPLSGKLGKGKYAIIDDEDHQWIGQYRWCLSDTGYARTSMLGKMVKMHHLILPNCPTSMVRDHINRNKLDNRRRNLRFVTHRQNQLNQSPRNDNTSGSRGVHWRAHGKWQARAWILGKAIHLGYFDSVDEAVKARESFYEAHL